MKFTLFATWWAICWVSVEMAGDWYDSHFVVFNALIALSLMVVALKWVDQWWCKEFACISVLQIFLNVGDALWSFPLTNYNLMQDALNYAELATILGFGLPTQLYRSYFSGEPADNGSDTGRGPDGAAQRVSGRQGRHA